MLKVLMLKKKRDDAQKQLDELRAKAEAFATREAELEADIAEASTDEKKAAVEEAITAFDSEKAENEKETQRLSDIIEQYDNEIAETETKANEPAPVETEQRSERKESTVMENLTITTTRAREMFGSMSIEQRSAMFEREDVKNFMNEIRTCITEKRALSNVGVTIPEVYLGLIRENVEQYSKLYKHVYVRPVKGEGRMTIMGALPEAVWTEMCANLNEMDLGFNDVEVDGYKVGGFIPVCNANLEDSDVELAAEIINAIAQAIAKALDKAILYGKGVKMPLGVMTRLAQTNAPENPTATARQWIDLSSTNIKTIAANKTGADLYKELLLDSAAASTDYGTGELVWAMNKRTYAALKAAMLSVNAAGNVVSAIDGNTLPLIGGTVETLSFIPDNVIIGGYFSVYLLAERAGTKIGQSEHYRFLADQTIFKGSARYDGLPVIPEAFVAIGINGTTPTAEMLFAPDAANSIVVTPATVSVLEQSDSVYGVSVSDLQSADTMLSGNNFYGTLKYVSSGEPATSWGAGYFLAIDFGGIDLSANKVEVGLVPSAGSGFVTVPADDHKSYFKVTNKDAQVLKVVTTKDGVTVSETYSLKGLKFQPTGA